MITHLRRSIIVVLVFTVFFGFVYAFAGHRGRPGSSSESQADGSITANGSTLIGQNWSQTQVARVIPWAAACSRGVPTPSAPTPARRSPVAAGGDNPLEANNIPGQPGVLNSGESSATNLGPRSETLLENTQKLVAYWKARGVNPTPDLVTTSGSGIDPDITPQDALRRDPHGARGRPGSPRRRCERLIGQQTQGMPLGFLGSPYVNVLQLNEALAKLKA